MHNKPLADPEMREYALHHKHRHDAITLLEQQPERLPLWAVCLLLSPTNDPKQHREIATRLTSLTQTGAVRCTGHPFHEFEPSHSLETLRRTWSGPVPFSEIERDPSGKPSQDHSAYSVELLRDDVRRMLEIDGRWPLGNNVPLCAWFTNQGNDSKNVPHAPRSHDRNRLLQQAANELAERWKRERPAGFSKREIAMELAKSDDWKDLTAIRVERIIKVDW